MTTEPTEQKPCQQDIVRMARLEHAALQDGPTGQAARNVLARRKAAPERIARIRRAAIEAGVADRPNGNAPDIPSPEAVGLLILIAERVPGGGPRPPKSRERDQLKRAGLIYSKPPNWSKGSPGIGCHAYQWFATPRGVALLQYLDEVGK